MKSPNVGELIDSMPKETLEALLASENLSILGTKQELKIRLRDFINDRRDSATQDDTTFEPSFSSEHTHQTQGSSSASSFVWVCMETFRVHDKT